ncbi:MAG: hypothetical protein ACJAS1_004699 [Oleiphilaceae bacterium]|jgi:hypothetical protein
MLALVNNYYIYSLVLSLGYILSNYLMISVKAIYNA